MESPPDAIYQKSPSGPWKNPLLDQGTFAPEQARPREPIDVAEQGGASWDVNTPQFDEDGDEVYGSMDGRTTIISNNIIPAKSAKILVE